MDLAIGQVWLVECSRCANEGVSYEESPVAARNDLTTQGWTRESDDWTYCPACNGSRGR